MIQLWLERRNQIGAYDTLLSEFHLEEEKVCKRCKTLVGMGKSVRCRRFSPYGTQYLSLTANKSDSQLKLSFLASWLL